VIAHVGKLVLAQRLGEFDELPRVGGACRDASRMHVLVFLLGGEESRTCDEQADSERPDGQLPVHGTSVDENSGFCRSPAHSQLI
jgi:hypothetical protein